MDRDKLAAVKSDVEAVEKETEENMHTLVLMDRLARNIYILHLKALLATSTDYTVRPSVIVRWQSSYRS